MVSNVCTKMSCRKCQETEKGEKRLTPLLAQRLPKDCLAPGVPGGNTQLLNICGNWANANTCGRSSADAAGARTGATGSDSQT